MRAATFLVGAALVLSLGAEAQAQAAGKRGKKLAHARTPVPRSTAASPPRKAPQRAAQKTLARLTEGDRRYGQADYVAAQQELAPLADEPLLNQDMALYLLASSEALLLPAKAEKALEHFRRVDAAAAVAGRGGAGAAQGKRSRFHFLSQARAADMLFALGRDGEAKRAYLEVLRSPSPEVDPAVAEFRLGAIAEREHDGKAALARYREVYLEHPAHPLADRALERILVVEGVERRQAVSPQEHLLRAQRYTNAHAWPRALEELALVAGEVPAALRDELDYWEGMTHFKMRRGYDIAAQKLSSVWPRLPRERQSDALFHGARAYSRAEQDDRAIAGYRQLLVEFPHARQAPEAAFLIGWLDFNRGHYKDALAGLSACLASYGASEFGDDARWYLGLAKWMLGDSAGALVDFDLIARRGGALDGGKGRYWKGRALAKLGRHDEAAATWQKLVEDYPFSYYAIQSRVRLAERGVTVGPFGNSVGNGVGKGPAGVEAGAGVEARHPVSPPGAVDERLTNDPDLARADELLRAGLLRDAGVELDRVDGPLLSRYGADRAVPILLDRYLRAGDYFHTHRLAEAHSGAALRTDPSRDAGARAWWELVYPLAYRPFVEKYAATGNNPTYYLYTIMQKESAYNPHDLSYADAIGLLQMIPPTSRHVGVVIGHPYTDDVLYDPEGNIQFGAWYIGHLLEKFKGQVALGAGSFNAGPKAMMRWLDANGARPLDEFIELCPYTQTREYMKKVLDIYSRYLYLYDRRDYLPEETIDAQYIKNEIDY